MSKDGGEAGALGGWLNLFLLVFEFLVKAEGCSSSSLNTRHLSTQAPFAACSHHLLQISISASFFVSFPITSFTHFSILTSSLISTHPHSHAHKNDTIFLFS